LVHFKLFNRREILGFLNGVKDGFSFLLVAAPVHDAMRSLSPVFLGLPTLPTLPEPSAAANDPKKKSGVTPAAAVLSDSSSSSESSSDDRLVKDYFFC
jgi:hypothetical protein